jgi:hypothetical protein
VGPLLSARTTLRHPWQQIGNARALCGLGASVGFLRKKAEGYKAAARVEQYRAAVMEMRARDALAPKGRGVKRSGLGA